MATMAMRSEAATAVNIVADVFDAVVEMARNDEEERKKARLMGTKVEVVVVSVGSWVSQG